MYCELKKKLISEMMKITANLFQIMFSKETYQTTIFTYLV